MGPTARLLAVIVVMAVLEVSWALACAVLLPQTDSYLVVFYGGLVAASLVFFVPGVASKARPPA
ncbi:MAG: hypothetical protein JRN58_07190 [Nitrososphaerota archaeon]|nr:hypothetical protein [Nitrososphaerota archaeon]MDG6967213.1 hypothetical protein [Nitrososphaerota archaeon]MDG6978848.1 hypothetical protein [Nitrososphaerota archaeon]